MDYQTTDQWNEQMWSEVEQVYHEAFPEHGRKNRMIVRRMFNRGICTLHTWIERNVIVAMALTAFNSRGKVLVIDYLAVRRSSQGKGVGRLCIENIRDWAKNSISECRGLVIEVEAEDTEENADRILFWQKVGFQLTDYIQSYIWVPETYRAMFYSFDADSPLTDDGKQLFKAITDYHEKAYRGK